MKYCPKCEQNKEYSNFSKNKCTKDGYQGYCKECSSKIRNKEKAKEYYRENLDYFRQKAKDYYPINKDKYNANRKIRREQNIEKRMLASAKERAKKKNLEFNIELSDIIIPEFCPILEIPLQKGNKTVNKNSPSLDRIDSSLGYIKGNIQVISNLANTMKNNANKEEIIVFCMNMLELLYEREECLIQ